MNRHEPAGNRHNDMPGGLSIPSPWLGRQLKLAVGNVVRNGVSVSQLTDTATAIEQDPLIARFQFRPHHEWLDATPPRHACHGFLRRE